MSGRPTHAESLTRWPAARAVAPAGTLLFLPGQLTDPLAYERLLAGLAGDGFTVYAARPALCRGNGARRRPATFGDLVRSGARALERVRAQAGCPVHLLGTGPGALVAIALAARLDGIATTIVHNLVDPASAQALGMTRCPDWLRRHPRSVRAGMRAAARLAPAARVPGRAVLDGRRICGQAGTRARLATDPAARAGYPLRFLSSLFDADLSGAVDGSIDCSVITLAAARDRVLPLECARRMHERIAAPHKELVVLDAEAHLLLSECPDLVREAIAARLTARARPAGPSQLVRGV